MSEFRSITRTLVRGASVTAAVLFVGYLLQYGLNVVLARELGPVDYGDFALAMGLLTFVTTLALMGGDSAIVRYFPVYMTEKRSGYAKGILWFFIGLVAFIGLLVGGVGMLLWGLGCGIVYKAGTGDLHPVVLLLWFIPAAGFVRLIAAMQRGRKRFAQAAMLQDFFRPGVFGVLLLVVVSLEWHLSDWEAAGLAGVSCVVVALYAFLRERCFVWQGKSDEKAVFRPVKWLETGIPAMGVVLTQIALSQLDMVMIEILAADEAQLGVYAAVTKVTEFGIILSLSISAVVSPLVQETAKFRKQYLNPLYRTQLLMRLAVFSVFIVPAVMFAGDFLSLFGQEYVAGARALQILFSGLILSSIGMGCAVFMRYLGKAHLIAWANGGMVIVNALLNWWLIPVIGIEGAAIATTATYALNMVAVLWLTKRHLGLSPFAMPSASI